MGRRGRRIDPTLPQSLGDTHVANACSDLNIQAMTKANVMCSFTHPRHHVITSLFEPDVINRLAAAKGLYEPNSVTGSYDVAGCTLWLGFENAMIDPPASDKVAPQPSATDLLAYIESIKAIHFAYEEVKAVLRWLNTKATAGAARFYFPAVLELCDKSPALTDLQECPSRYREPDGIGDWIQTIKDAATTVTSSLLLPKEAGPKQVTGMRLSIPSKKVYVGNNSEYDTDMRTFHI